LWQELQVFTFQINNIPQTKTFIEYDSFVVFFGISAIDSGSLERCFSDIATLASDFSEIG